MSLSRAFTSRRARQSSVDMGGSENTPRRSSTVSKHHPGPVSIRNKISNPMVLTHTTNMLAYNAPDLYPHQSPASQMSSPTYSVKSDDDSSCLDTPSTVMSSPPTSPEMSTDEKTYESPARNHLSCYFVPPNQKPAPVPSEAPAIPKRAPSHTKKTSFELNHHTRLSYQSSAMGSSKASSVMSRASSASTLATSVSSGSHSQKLPTLKLASIPAVPSPPSSAPPRRPRDDLESTHPFGQELAKVSELAEELGVKDKFLQGIDEEERQLVAKGLMKFTAEDYLAEIDELISDFLSPEPSPLQQPVWI
ncbi:hypothetical protein GGS21DRAFT_488787 [Xylaria nigripes]|nr:hypothetical protein GGS21DRAFT_488787 [Xylaria nigripes]